MENLNYMKLVAAIKLQQIELVKTIVNSGIDVNRFENTVLESPLNIAINQGDFEIVKVLMDAGAIPENFMFLTAADYIQKRCYQTSENILNILLALIDSKIDIDTLLETERTFLMEAAYDGATEVVQLLVEFGSNVNFLNRRGQYALLMAARAGQEEVYRYLEPITLPELKLEAEKELHSSLQRKEENNQILYHRLKQAVNSLDSEGLKEVLNRGIDIDYCNFHEDSLLCQASIIGNTEMVIFLLQNGANPNLLKQNTPLISAIGYIESGRSQGGQDRVSEYLDIINMLIEWGADVNLADQNGFTPLVAAISSGSIEAVNILLDFGVNVNSVDSQERTPLSYAVEIGYSNIIQLLLHAGAVE